MNAPDSNKISLTDWERLTSPADDDIDYSEIPPLDDDFFKNAHLRLPQRKATVTIRLDSDVLAWFKAQGKGYQTRINAVLKAYKEAHETAASPDRST